MFLICMRKIDDVLLIILKLETNVIFFEIRVVMY